MAKTLRGCPAPGKLVRDPAHDFKPVPEAVADYPADGYWRRRFAQGDMIAQEAGGAVDAPVAAAQADGSEATGEGDTTSTRNRRGA